MSARVLDGIAVANQIRSELVPVVAAFTARVGRPPGLGIVLVGDDPASHVYVGAKLKSAAETGLRADAERLPANASLEDLLAVVDRLNRSDVHDGILVQSPLPEAMGAGRGTAGVRRGAAGQGRRRIPSDQRRVAGAEPGDAHRLHAVGRDRAARAVEHRHRRRAGGGDWPQRHRRQADGAAVAAPARDGDDLSLADAPTCRGSRREADILVSAIGRPGFVTADFVKPGAAVVDVGTTPVSDRAIVERLFPPGSKRHEAFERRGSLVIGDVHPEVANVAGALSPVPGGAGPLTIALLLRNTLLAAEARFKS